MRAVVIVESEHYRVKNFARTGDTVGACLTRQYVNEDDHIEPITLWRLHYSDGRVARAVMVPHGFGCSVIWWINESVEGACELSDWERAIQHAERLGGE